MRDLLICKKCGFFGENCYMLPYASKEMWRVHECLRGDVKFDKMEFYKTECLKTCPYYTEHFMSEIYSEENIKEVDYSFWRHFKRKRVCQHCGRTIPNRKTCPVCGYDWYTVVGFRDTGFGRAFCSTALKCGEYAAKALLFPFGFFFIALFKRRKRKMEETQVTQCVETDDTE